MRLTRTFNAGHDNLYLNKDDVNRLLKGQMLKVSSLIVQMENPEREWVGLTDEDLKLLSAEWRIVYGAWMDDFARDIEAKLKDKNT